MMYRNDLTPPRHHFFLSTIPYMQADVYKCLCVFGCAAAVVVVKCDLDDFVILTQIIIIQFSLICVTKSVFSATFRIHIITSFGFLLEYFRVV